MAANVPSNDEVMFEFNDVSAPEPESGTIDAFEDSNYGAPSKNEESSFKPNVKEDPFVSSLLINSRVFTLSALESSYTVMCSALCIFQPFAYVRRLKFIARHCPPHQTEALQLILQVIYKRTKDVRTFLDVRKQLVDLGADVTSYDASWVAATQKSCATSTEILLTEYKKQKDEGVKESTRRVMEDLFYHYSLMGQHSEAIKLYSRGMRDNCSQFRHVLTMYKQWIICSIENDDWSKMDTLLSYVDRAIRDAQESEKAAAQLNSNQIRVLGTNQRDNIVANVQLIKTSRSEFEAVRGVSNMRHGNTEQAARAFIRVNPDQICVPWVFSLSDIAQYGLLCALATLDRKELKKLSIGAEDSNFKRLLETDIWLLNVLNAFVRHDFSYVIDEIESRQNMLLLDPHLCSQLSALCNSIRKRAITIYLSAFQTADLKKAASLLRFTTEEFEEELMAMCEAGSLNIRIDSINGIIHVPPQNARNDAIENVLASAEAIIESSKDGYLKALLLTNRVFPHAESRGKRKPLQSQEQDCVRGFRFRRQGTHLTRKNSGSFDGVECDFTGSPSALRTEDFYDSVSLPPAPP